MTDHCKPKHPPAPKPVEPDAPYSTQDDDTDSGGPPTKPIKP